MLLHRYQIVSPQVIDYPVANDHFKIFQHGGCQAHRCIANMVVSIPAFMHLHALASTTQGGAAFRKAMH